MKKNWKRPFWITGLIYAFPLIGMSMILSTGSVITGVYAKYFGISLTAIASVMLISRIVDAVSDPIIGYLSDRYQERNGTRKPFILIGGIGVIFVSYFLLVPVQNPVSFSYFLFWYVLLYIIFTVFDIPHYAWSSEITPESNKRTFLFSLRSMIMISGAILFFLVPSLPIFETKEITPEVLEASLYIGAPLILLGVVSATYFIKGDAVTLANREQSSDKINSFEKLKEVFKAIAKNKPFQVFILAFTFYALAIGTWGGVLFFLVDIFLGMGERFAEVAIYSMISMLLFMPVWYKVSIWIGKRNAWMLAMTILIICFAYSTTLSQETATFTEILVLVVLQSCGNAILGIIPPSMLTDIIDYGKLKNRLESTSSYFSTLTFFVKAEGALGAALGLAVAGWFGFDATATEQTESGIFGFQLAIAWIPLFLSIIGLIIIWFSPLNERRMKIIRKRLAQLEEREK